MKSRFRLPRRQPGDRTPQETRREDAQTIDRMRARIAALEASGDDDEQLADSEEGAPSVITESNAPFLEAVALIRAQQRRDEFSLNRILASADTAELAVVLAQMTQTAIRTQGMSVDDFLQMQVDASLDAARSDEADLPE